MTTAAVRGGHRAALLLFIVVWLSCGWFLPRPENPNTATRLFTALSLVEQGDATIDEFEGLTIDKARFGEHFYADKQPGMSLMAIPAVALANTLTGQTSADIPLKLGDPALERFMAQRIWLAVLTGPALLTALAAVLLFDLGTGITGSQRAGMVGAAAYALGSPIWGWSTTLFGHASVAALMVIAIWAVWRGTSEGLARLRPRYPLMLGACLGWALVIELPAALPGAVVGLWCLWRVRGWPLASQWRAGALTLVACMAALAPLAAYNLLAFGTMLRTGYQGVVGFEGMQQGWFGLTYPHVEVLAQIIAGPDRGLIFVTPVLMLAPFGLARMAKRPNTVDIARMAIAAIAIVLLYNASYYYWDGGHSTGPRHSLPALGFAAIGLPVLWQAWDESGRRLMLGLLGLSIFINLGISAAEVAAPHGFHFPVYDPVMTRFLSGEIRTAPGLLLGWQEVAGLCTYLVLAAPLAAGIISDLRQSPQSRP